MSSQVKRASGILLHPTSLPGRWGIGDLGTAAYEFVDFLAAAGQSLWQILPLGPTGYGNSPYQSPSAFAGNPLLIGLDSLAKDGLLDPNELAMLPTFSSAKVDFDLVSSFKMPLLGQSFERFKSGDFPHYTQAFNAFCTTNATWLDDYTLFMALKERFQDASWSTWDRNIKLRLPKALDTWKKELAGSIELQKYLQFLFFTQWQQLKTYANERKIQIIGDLPIYVAYDSADVWVNPHLFKLDDEGKPTVISGVPPDVFSKTGQRWGNPIYRWDKMAKDGFTWWLSRLEATFNLVDIVRIDHFLAFNSYWEIPASEETAVNGKWVPGPGAAFFQLVQEKLGDLPVIAEDLGLITKAVKELRDQFNLPGMKILHFAFGDTARNPYLPHNYQHANCIVYTGTHDNNTTLGWFESLAAYEREAVQRYLGRDGTDISWDLIRLAFGSIAKFALIPLQDVLRLGSEGYMNRPGKPLGNWAWRFGPNLLTPELATGLRSLTETYGRFGGQENQAEEEEV